MIQLTPQNIRIGARAANKNEAIRAAGQVLVESGCIEPGYIESMIGREGQANTYLGNGISIPHGMAKDRELIRATGISVVQMPDGVEWGPGKKAHIIVGIAAKSDEHLGILAALTDVLDDPGRAELLSKTKDANDIITGLSREAAAPGGEPAKRPRRRLQAHTTWMPRSLAAPECMRDLRRFSPISRPSSNRIFEFSMAPRSRTGSRWPRFLSWVLPAVNPSGLSRLGRTPRQP